MSHTEHTTLPLLRPDWAAPQNVQACVTTRLGGVSLAPFDALNLALHVGDDARAVAANRMRLRQSQTNLPQEPVWLEQVHGTDVVTLPLATCGDVSLANAAIPKADAAVSFTPGEVCVVMTADCLPVLFCRTDGTGVGAAHAGWRGLLDGVLENTVTALRAGKQGRADQQNQACEVIAWLGPAIGPQAFEVGPEVRTQFIARDASAVAAFVPGQGDRWFADIYALARMRLQAVGVTQVQGGQACTFLESSTFFSYRRDGRTGRMASLIWMTA